MQIKGDEMNILVEALPYLSAFKGKTVVVKYGGNAMLSDDLKNKGLQDIVFLRLAGMRPVVVHGGGPEITAMLKQAGKKSEFVSGLRVTDAETVAIAELALVGRTNTDLVRRLNILGGNAIGLNGKDGKLLEAKKHLADVYEDGQVNLVDIGFVGTVDKINTDLLNLLIQNDYIPVIAPIGLGADGETYNINADSVAGEVAGALKAEKLLMLTDVRGKGLLIGAELSKAGACLVGRALEKGFIINCTAGNVLRFVPPLIITEGEIDQLLQCLDELLAEF